MMYNIDIAFKNSGLSAREIEKIKRDVRSEFPNDDMMYELHIIRILKAIKKGYWKVPSS
ncbi:MAG: hypothetical protein JSW00_11680 [Thermoplasmata archaeon]|nr:MAG: hypothetical protein JSW00_11680 [Thermoplasmata archaeon]